jgi:CheY-like chemotaxis protein
MSAADLRRLRVLVTDPNTFMRGVIAESLRLLNVNEIAFSANAAETISLSRTVRSDLLIVDWDAGKMSGLDFTRLIRHGQTPFSREIPIILLAGQVQHDQIVAAREAGVTEFLLKPVSAQSLHGRIEEIIERPRKFIECMNFVGPCRRRKDDPRYSGPWRRLLDDPPEDAGRSITPEEAEKLRAIITLLSDYAARIHRDRAAGIRGMYRLLVQYTGDTTAIGDDVINRVWSTLFRYIEGIGLTDRYDFQVVNHHLMTIRALIDTPDRSSYLRHVLADELGVLVDRKIHRPDEPDAAAA